VEERFHALAERNVLALCQLSRLHEIVERVGVQR
jgi:hypothetical protein